MKESQAIDSFSALAHDIRLRIIRYLVENGKEGAPAGLIGENVGAAPSKISFHIAILERAELVTSERVSRQIIYRVNFSQFGFLVSYLLNDCCNTNDEVLSCCGVSLVNSKPRCC